MVQSSELMAGNYVRYSNTGIIFQVDSISEKGLDVSNSEESTWIELEQFEPILLTGEELINLGFKETVGSNFTIGQGEDSIRIFLDTVCEVTLIFFKNDLMGKISRIKFTGKYVHELQNTYYWSTNKKQLKMK